ncbi:zinc-binding alcohol dehydrogenase [Halomonas sp. HP20-15]|uniref:zinc-dependent alcohol dehydrogenase n=1 Tax=Halomonas sp. HP20-15 TaxID=3085901 RepID=UPI00298274FC|nr:zinc-binding alcohol dehydrogenase [Halomonas sp. HP20-15]MDW5376590.1 zinc-binding alcohol dehydrogenase [Halomonas sp. HP20-15]
MPAMTAQAFWTLAPGQGALRQETLPPLGDDDVLVRNRFSAISRGSEALVFNGRVPPSEYARMRAPFQAGEFPGPVKYGYAGVGTVEQGPEGLLGRSVFCLHPHQDRYVVPADAVVPLPDDLPAARGVLAANMETAVNGLWDAGPRPGDRIAVIGAGVVGALIAYLCARIPGTRVELIDIDSTRAELAAALDVPFSTPEAACGDADLVIHASGNAAGLRHGLALAGHEALLIEMSWYGTQPVSLPLGEAFHARRLTLRSSQVGTVSPARSARWSHRRRLALALDLLRDERLDALIDGESDFVDLPALMPRLAEAHGVLCHRLRY